MYRKESWGATAVPKEAHFTQEGPTTENARAWLVEVRAKGKKVTLVPFSGVNCDPGCDSKDLVGRPEQDPADTSRLRHQHLKRFQLYHSDTVDLA